MKDSEWHAIHWNGSTGDFEEEIIPTWTEDVVEWSDDDSELHDDVDALDENTRSVQCKERTISELFDTLCQYQDSAVETRLELVDLLKEEKSDVVADVMDKFWNDLKRMSPSEKRTAASLFCSIIVMTGMTLSAILCNTSWVFRSVVQSPLKYGHQLVFPVATLPMEDCHGLKSIECAFGHGFTLVHRSPLLHPLVMTETVKQPSNTSFYPSRFSTNSCSLFDSAFALGPFKQLMRKNAPRIASIPRHSTNKTMCPRVAKSSAFPLPALPRHHHLILRPTNEDVLDITFDKAQMIQKLYKGLKQYAFQKHLLEAMNRKLTGSTACSLSVAPSITRDVVHASPSITRDLVHIHPSTTFDLMTASTTLDLMALPLVPSSLSVLTSVSFFSSTPKQQLMTPNWKKTPALLPHSITSLLNVMSEKSLMPVKNKNLSYYLVKRIKKCKSFKKDIQVY